MLSLLNQEQWNSLIRGVIIFLAGILVSKGYISAADSAVLVTASLSLVGAVAAIGPIVWGIVSRSHAAMIKSVQAADNGVDVVKAGSGGIIVNPDIKPDLPKK